MKKLYSIFIFLFLFAQKNFAQDTLNKNQKNSLHPGKGENKLNKQRLYTVAGLHAAGYTGTIYLLGQTWYKNYPKSSFHTFNDSKEWLQVDKIGHAWTSYNLAKYSTATWRWAGVRDNKAVLSGAASSLAFQTIIEYFDAHSAEWGWSWADVAANISGTGLYTAQELLWNEQKILFKFSAHKKNYPYELNERADNLYGNSLAERILKDYNGQTYWLSFNVKSLLHKSNFPRWLNIAIGYGGDGMFGGFENLAKDKNGNIIFDRRDIARKRQWYISPDIDLSKIKTNKKAVRTILNVFNVIKIPAPAIEYSKGKLAFHAVYF